MSKTRNKKIIGVAAFGLLFILGLAVSIPSSLKIGYISSGVGNTLTASYYYFNGIESREIKGEPGEVIAIAYDSDVKKGSLRMKVQSPEGKIYPLDSEEASRDMLEIPVNRRGTFTLIIEGEATRGSFSVSWSRI